MDLSLCNRDRRLRVSSRCDDDADDGEDAQHPEDFFLFWFAYIFFNVSIPSVLGEEDAIIRQLFIESLQLPLKLVATYSLIYFLIPQFLLKRKYYLFFLIVIPLAFVIGTLQRYLLGKIIRSVN